MAGGLVAPDEDVDQAVTYASKGGIYFVLVEADLQVGKVGKVCVLARTVPGKLGSCMESMRANRVTRLSKTQDFRLLNSDEHAQYLQRKGEDASLYRPDICHQSLLAVLDSPLNKAGVVKKIFVHSKKNVLIDVHPQVRLPRTFRRFCGLFVQLLQKLSVRSSNSKDRLLKVVKGPVTRYLPTGAKRIVFSHRAPETKDMFQYVKPILDEGPVVFVVGAFANGNLDVSYSDEEISISNYELSAAQALTRITSACEQHLNII